MNNMTHTKRQRFDIFVERSLKTNMLTIRNIINFTGKYRGTTHSIFNLKYIIPKEITVILITVLSSLFYHKRASRRISS